MQVSPWWWQRSDRYSLPLPPLPGISVPASNSGGNSVPASNSGGASVPASTSGGDSVPASTSGGDSVPASTSGGDSVPASTSGGDSVPASLWWWQCTRQYLWWWQCTRQYLWWWQCTCQYLFGDNSALNNFNQPTCYKQYVQFYFQRPMGARERKRESVWESIRTFRQVERSFTRRGNIVRRVARLPRSWLSFRTAAGTSRGSPETRSGGHVRPTR